MKFPSSWNRHWSETNVNRNKDTRSLEMIWPWVITCNNKASRTTSFINLSSYCRNTFGNYQTMIPEIMWKKKPVEQYWLSTMIPLFLHKLCKTSYTRLENDLWMRSQNMVYSVPYAVWQLNIHLDSFREVDMSIKACKSFKLIITLWHWPIHTDCNFSAEIYFTWPWADFSRGLLSQQKPKRELFHTDCQLSYRLSHSAFHKSSKCGRHTFGDRGQSVHRVPFY